MSTAGIATYRLIFLLGSPASVRAFFYWEIQQFASIAGLQCVYNKFTALARDGHEWHRVLEVLDD
jgi:hypothetical protein